MKCPKCEETMTENFTMMLYESAVEVVFNCHGCKHEEILELTDDLKYRQYSSIT